MAHDEELIRSAVQLRDICRELLKDVHHNIEEAYRDPPNMPARRNSVRSNWAYAEALTAGLGGLAVRFAEATGQELTPEQVAFFESWAPKKKRMAGVRVRPAWQGTASTVLTLYREVSVVFGVEVLRGFTADGEKAITEALEKRHSLAHPKSTESIDVSDDDLRAQMRALEAIVQVYGGVQEAQLKRVREARERKKRNPLEL